VAASVLPKIRCTKDGLHGRAGIEDRALQLIATGFVQLRLGFSGEGKQERFPAAAIGSGFGRGLENAAVRGGLKRQVVLVRRSERLFDTRCLETRRIAERIEPAFR